MKVTPITSSPEKRNTSHHGTSESHLPRTTRPIATRTRLHTASADRSHAFGSNVADAGGAADEIADLMGHRSLSSTKVYLHPDPARLRAAVERVPSPRLAAGEA
jgi:site-specific recombinase XerD